MENYNASASVANCGPSNSFTGYVANCSSNFSTHQFNRDEDGFMYYETSASAQAYTNHNQFQAGVREQHQPRVLQTLDMNRLNGESADSSSAMGIRFDSFQRSRHLQPTNSASSQDCSSSFTSHQQSFNENYSSSSYPTFLCQWIVKAPNFCWMSCHQTFSNLYELVTHLNTFHVKKEAKATYRCCWENCDRISKPFKERSKLEAHIRIHTGEKPYPCKYCNKLFARSENMTNHLRTHTGMISGASIGVKGWGVQAEAQPGFCKN